MKKTTCVLALVTGLSISNVYAFETRSVCSTIVQTSDANDEVIDSIKSGLGGEHLEVNGNDIVVTYTSNSCQESKELSNFNVSVNGNGLPTPDLPSEGDKRTTEQVRGNIKTTYNQVYREGTWVTTSFTRVDISESEDKHSNDK